MTALPQHRPFVWLSLLLLLNLFLLSLQVRDEQGRILIRAAGLILITPVSKGVEGVASGVGGFLDRWAFLRDAARENESLRLENSRLRIEVAQLRALAGLLPRSLDWERMRRGFQFETALAQVVGMSAPFFGDRILIDAGRSRGVPKDAAVLSSTGVVGRVAAASVFSSEVELITNQGAGAGALIAGSGLQGVVRGDGSEILRLDYVSNVEDVPEGALVVTSGADRIYPKGVAIGVVVASRKSGVIYQDIQVRPATDFSRLQEVLVVLPDATAAGSDESSEVPADERKP